MKHRLNSPKMQRSASLVLLFGWLCWLLTAPLQAQIIDFNLDSTPIGSATGQTTSLAWADWDGDGDLDLAVGNRGEPNQIYENVAGLLKFDPDQADLTQRFGWQSTESSQTTSLAWGDWDWDGDLDLAVGNWGEPTQIYQNNDGNLSLAWQSNEVAQTTSLAWESWQDAQGHSLAVGNDGQPNRVYQATGTGMRLIWQSAEADRTTSLAWGDWNKDGSPDLAVGNFEQSNQIYQSDATGFSLVWQSDELEKTTSLAWADWDNDQDLDLAVGNAGQPNRVYQNDSGQLSPVWQSPTADNTTSLAWADWNGDGFSDLAVGNDNEANRVYQNDNGQLRPIWQSVEQNQTTSIAWGDLDQDDLFDLASGNRGQRNFIQRNAPIGAFTIGPQLRLDGKTILATETWHSDLMCAPGHCGRRARYERLFQAPPGAVEVEISATWVWEGLFVGQEQNEESFYVRAAGREGLCEDQGNGPVADGLCWQTRFARTTDLNVVLRHFVETSQQAQTAESIKAIVEVTWYGEATAPPSCTGLDLGLSNGSIISPLGVKTDLTVYGENGSQYRLVRTDAQGLRPEIVAPAQSNPTFAAVTVLPDVPYQAQVGNDDGVWSETGCTFQYRTERMPPHGTATCNQAAIVNPNVYPITVNFRIDGQSLFQGNIAAESMHLIDYRFNDVAIHRPEFSWMGAGEEGLVELDPFGPCGAATPTATASCTGGSVTNPNPFPIDIDYQVDGNSIFSGQVDAGTTLPINYAFNDGATHTAEISWSGNGESGTLTPDSFGPCGALPPTGTATCTGGTITNPNSFPIQVVFTVDGTSQFSGQVAANSSQPIPYTFADGAIHTAAFSWSGNGRNGQINLGQFGPCGALPPTGTATCTGGTVTNPNSFPIQVIYTVDGLTQFNGTIPANTTQPINFNFNTGSFHTAGFSWSGNGENGLVNLGSFGPCGAATPVGTATCSGGAVTNPNSFPIQVVFTVDGLTQFSGIVAANTTQPITYNFSDGATHAAAFSWSGNGENGIVAVGSFGPCSALTPNGTATCIGGTVTNPNGFPIQITYTVDGQTVFQGQVAANSTAQIPFTFTDGSIHTAQFSWAGNGENGLVNLGSFGPCGAAAPTGTATCTGGTIVNPNSFPIQVIYTVDGQTIFQDQVAANTNQPIAYAFTDVAVHNAAFSWAGNGQTGQLDLGSFGPCGAATPTATVSCNGGAITNPNPFPIQATFTVDGATLFQGQVAASATQAIDFTLNDGALHQAEFSWSGNGLSDTVNLGEFGPCGAVAAPGTATCTGGTITNPNPFPIQATFTVDGATLFQGQVAANSTQPVSYTFNDGATHTAAFSWTGNGQSGVVDLGNFGPCGANIPSGTATCDGGTITNPNPFPIQVDFTVDGLTEFSGQVAANSSQPIDYRFEDTAIHIAAFTWAGNGESGAVTVGLFGPCGTLEPTGTAGCSGGSVTNPNPFPILVTYLVDGRTVFKGQVPANSTQLIPYTYKDSSTHRAEFSWSGNGRAGTVDLGSFGPCQGANNQYQDFIGPVPFGFSTPDLEFGQEYFDGPRSVMYNVEFITAENQADVVFRFNGRELNEITTSIFNNETFRQIESQNGRATTDFTAGPTKLIGYRYGKERTRIFQTFTVTETARWIHPLDQPFEHKPTFILQLHGPPNQVDQLVYGDQREFIEYDSSGVATTTLTYRKPGLVAVYPTPILDWLTVDAVTLALTGTQSVTYDFAETGLYHYRVVDGPGQIVAPTQPQASLTFTATQNTTYYPQLVYPKTSLFVAVLDAMGFKHTSHWLMPLDASQEQVFEFHVDYHRLDDPDLGADHIRGDIVIEALYLLNTSGSVADQFPYGRHDGALPGVTIVGIPDVSLVAFCGRPGVHELVYWGGWENETYYRSDVERIFDPNLYDEWTAEQRGDCVDAAHRINMLLARAGLRTDHTFRHHGQRSQGYQLSQQHAWSPYNLVGLRPPHVGRLLKPGTVVSYYSNDLDLLFWGWDLAVGGLADGVDRARLEQHIQSLGPIEYIDQTGRHPPEALNR